MALIGRENETRELLERYHRSDSQLIALYGRRRVGKTFLIDETFKGKITFRHAGLSPIDESGKYNLLRAQLKHFYHSLERQGLTGGKCPQSWFEAFYLLENFLSSRESEERQVVFLDEMPWMDTPRSGFLTAFEGFWNGWGCSRDNLMVIVCGSANSWILNNLINNHGGLYGRVSCEICLNPFSLKETEVFFAERKISMSRYDLAQCQMILGGIPYYLDYFSRGYSLSQNIDRLFWGDAPKLKGEFDRLFASVFSKPEEMKAIIRTLSLRRKGLTRKEISKKTGKGSGGNLSKNLDALLASGFIRKYIPFGERHKDTYYQLIDPFCLFHLKFLTDESITDPYYWTNNQTNQRIVSWRGLAFEDLCLRHIEQIKLALGISGVVSEHSAWSISGEKEQDGAQIDLLIKRKDNVINMCEMKFYSGDYSIAKNDYKKILERISLLAGQVPKKFVVHPTLVTTFGLTYNEYSGVFVKTVLLDDLFQNPHK